MPGARAGIFGAPVAPPPDTRTAVTKSGIEGGIFGAPEMKRPTSSGGRHVTDSSVEGGAPSLCPRQTLGAASPHPPAPCPPAGVFGGYNHVEPAVSHARAPKLDSESLGAAGSSVEKSEAVSLSWSQDAAPLQPLPSARSNPNASSIQGGACARPIC